MRSLTAAVVAVLLLAPIAALADGCLMPSKANWVTLRERAYINEPEQKAVVHFTKGSEDLIISPSFEGPATSFAWVIPVPARPKVRILEGAIFHELAKLIEPPAVGKSGGTREAQVSAPTVTLLERRTVGAYDVSVLSANDGQALMNWLSANGYHLPDAAAAPVREYIKARWTFVACRVKAPVQAEQGLRAGTLAPLRLTFKASRPIYPLRLSSANPAAFSVVVYLVLPEREVGGAKSVALIGRPRGGPDKTPKIATINWWRRKECPTLMKLCKQNVRIYLERRYLQPDDCTRDYVWAPPVRMASRM